MIAHTHSERSHSVRLPSTTTLVRNKDVNMPVTGFPATVETLLTSLMSTNSLSSWKIAGEPENVVVVLRFRQDGQQPLQTRGHWKRKSSAQIRRDSLRAERHRHLGEQQKIELESFPSTSNKIDFAAKSLAHDLESAQEAQAKPCSLSTVTFDPQCVQSDSEVCPLPVANPILQCNSPVDHNAESHRSSIPNGVHPSDDGENVMDARNDLKDDVRDVIACQMRPVADQIDKLFDQVLEVAKVCSQDFEPSFANTNSKPSTQRSDCSSADVSKRKRRHHPPPTPPPPATTTSRQLRRACVLPQDDTVHTEHGRKAESSSPSRRRPRSARTSRR